MNPDTKRAISRSSCTLLAFVMLTVAWVCHWDRVDDEEENS